MALVEDTDFVFVAHAENLRGKLCFTGTREHLYIVPEEKTVMESSFKEFVTNALAKVNKVEKWSFGDQSPDEFIHALLL